MKKILIILLSIFVLPITVKAATLNIKDCADSSCSTSSKSVGYRKTNESETLYLKYNGTTFKATSYIYSFDGASNLFCLNPDLLNPTSVNKVFTLNQFNDPVEYGLLAIYRLYLLSDRTNENLVRANDAMRLFMARSIALGKYTKKSSSWTAYNGLTSSQLLTAYQNAASQMAGNGGNYIYTSTSSDKYKEVKKYFCAANLAAGYSISTCKGLFGDTDKKTNNYISMLKSTAHSRKIDISGKQADNNGNAYISASGDGKKNIAALVKTYPKLKNGSILTVENIECPSGYKCEIFGSKVDLIYDDQPITIKADSGKNTNSQVQVKVKLKYSFTWDSDSLNIYYGPADSYNSYQRLIDIRTSKTVTSDLTFKMSVVPTCKRDKNGAFKIGDQPVTVKEYIDGGCCDNLTIDDLKESDVWDAYNKSCNNIPDEINMNPEDIVDIKQTCGMECNEDKTGVKKNTDEAANTTTVMQFSMDSILDNIEKAESALYAADETKRINETDLNLVYAAYDRYILNDDKLAGNKYCKIFTSEKNYVKYPGYAISNSGRYFVFADDDKPYIDVDQNATLHINYLRHSKDGDKADSSAWNTCMEYKNAFNSKYSYNYNNLQGTFTYEQKPYDAKSDDGIIKTDVKLVVDTDKTKANLSSSSPTTKGTSSDSFVNTTIQTKGKIFLRPENKYYNTVGSGKIISDVTKEDEPSVVEIGYKYLVDITTREGQFNTYIDLSSLGNNGSVSKSIEKFASNNKTAKYTCVYCNRESVYTRNCPTCTSDEDDGDSSLKEQYIYRVVGLDDIKSSVKSTDGVVTNWGDSKGIAAAKEIKENVNKTSLSIKIDDKYENLDSTGNGDKYTSLEDNEDKAQLEELENIYSNKKYLEYEFNLNSSDLQIIKKNNKNYDYGSFVICGANSNKGTKAEDASYCYTCQVDGKECTSTFVTAFSDPDITNDTRTNKWKYYFYDVDTQTGSFKIGRINSIPEFFDGSKHSYSVFADKVYDNLNVYKNLP